MTVQGFIGFQDAGFILPHEHVMVDFIGAKKTGTHRYDPQEVIEVMMPYLNEAVALGVQTLFECTPMYLARDVRILQELSSRTGLHIVTNTGQYKEPYLPESTFALSAEELAQSWIAEWETGIEGTGIKPGFIKTAVHPNPLEDIQVKIIQAAAITSNATDLTITTHTGLAQPAGEILDILDKCGVAPHKWVFVHAQVENDWDALLEIARRGAWISLDGLNPESGEAHMRLLLRLLEEGYEDVLMLSHDAGWYHVGDLYGGQIQPFSYLTNVFIPQMKELGVSQEIIHKITTLNPFRAFMVTI